MESLVEPEAATEEPGRVTEKASPESFAAYFAKRLIAEEGFTEVTVDEAQPLASACDILLTYSDGVRFSMVCIVDAERDPSRRFSLGRAEVARVAAACAPYCGKIFDSPLSPSIRIVEIRSGIEDRDRARLRQYRAALFGKPHVVAAILSPSDGRAWNSRRLGLRLLLSHRRLLRAPRIPDAELCEPTVEPDAKVDEPYLTYGILGLLLAMFLAEMAWSVRGLGLLDTDVQTLLALGGLERHAVVAHHEWYRLLTAPLLHDGVLHLALNAFALFLGGLLLELLLGRAWLVAIFVLGAAGGTLLSVRVNPPGVVSVGASGAIMAMLSAGYVISRRLPRGPERRKIQYTVLAILVPSLLPLSLQSGARVDYGAHFGGALTGLAVGIGLRLAWKKSSPAPRFAWAGRVIAAVGMAAMVLALVQVKTHYAPYKLERLLIPAEVFEAADGTDAPGKAIEAQAEKLLAEHPRDPRSHLYRARQLISASQMNEPPRLVAEEELRLLLTDEPMLERVAAHYLDTRIEDEARAWLVALLLDREAKDEARAVAAPLCDGRHGKTPADFLEWKVCDR